jgi:hypothetical protein
MSSRGRHLGEVVDSDYGKQFTFRLSKLSDMITSLSRKSFQVGSEPNDEDP